MNRKAIREELTDIMATPGSVDAHKQQMKRLQNVTAETLLQVIDTLDKMDETNKQLDASNKDLAHSNLQLSQRNLWLQVIIAFTSVTALLVALFLHR